MPSSTFYHLPQEKRARLMDTVWQEFTHVPYADASIHRIIQGAGISRGSFYQYFSGKQDLFLYLFQTIVQDIASQFQAQLMAHGNDLFSAILGMYDLLVWKNSKSNGLPRLHQIQALIRLNREKDLYQLAEQLDLGNLFAQFADLAAESGFVLESRLEQQAALHLLLSTSISSFSDTIRHPANESRNRQLLEAQLSWIRAGLPRRKEAVSS